MGSKISATGSNYGGGRANDRLSARSPADQRGEPKNLLASERRKTVTVQAALYESQSNEIVSGPFRIEAAVDFDYVDGDSIQDLVFVGPNGISQVVLPFSLGQLESSEAAEEAAMRPLNVQIATKIVDAIFAERYYKVIGNIALPS